MLGVRAFLCVAMALAASPASAQADRVEMACFIEADAAACLREAYRLRFEEANVRHAAPVFAAACTLGALEGCRAAVELMVDRDDPSDPGWPRVAELLARACEGVVAGACHDLADLHTEGRGVPQDDARALKLYEKACALGDAEACR